MYTLGIARKAEPVDHLKKRYVDFQRRMLAAPDSPQPSPPRSIDPPSIRRRTVLGETISSTSRLDPFPPPDVFSTPQPNARLQIFLDPTGDAAGRAAGNEYPDVGTRISRTKENRPEVRKMGDGALPRNRAAQRSVSGARIRIDPFRDPPSRGTFVPFRDNEDAAAMPPPPTPSNRATSISRLQSPSYVEPSATPYPLFAPGKNDVCTNFFLFYVSTKYLLGHRSDT